ncbi:hypothetical protein HZB02_05690 [Candidatus Woesearchaeota archaeon]|nr:hypothetical protein [Candidatus Woesearchaeota archaeon]
MVEPHLGNVYVVDILGTLLASGGSIIPISQKVLGLDRSTLPANEIERVYFELLGPYIVPNPNDLYGDVHAVNRGNGTQNLFQGYLHMKSRFAAIDQVIGSSTEQALLNGIERTFDARAYGEYGHTHKVYVRLLPQHDGEKLMPLLLEIEKSQHTISPHLDAIAFVKLYRE